VVAVLACGPAAQATPLLAPRMGGPELTGAALGTPTSVYDNPAAIGLRPGTHLLLAGDLRASSLTIARDPIDGGPGGAPLAFESVHDTSWTPGLFAGVTSDLGSPTVTVGLAVYSPIAELGRLSGGDGSDPTAPARFHRVALRAFDLRATLAAAFRVSSRLYFGIGFTVAQSTLRLSFARDTALDGGTAGVNGPCPTSDGATTPCGFENPAAAEQLDLDTSAQSLGFSAGVAVRITPRVTLGVAFVSRPLGFGRSDIPGRGGATLRRSPRDGGTTLEGTAEVRYGLPDMVTVGTVWRPTPLWELVGNLRWHRLGTQQSFDIRLIGRALQGQVPERLVRYRGFSDVLSAELAARRPLGPRWTLTGSALFSTPAVDVQTVNAAAVDAPHVNLMLSSSVRVSRSWSALFGYEAGLYLPRTARPSTFDPNDQLRCVDSLFDLGTCRPVNAGKGLPSAAGRYSLLEHNALLALRYDFDPVE
jgi:long-subunit fatty acid transport protein